MILVSVQNVRYSFCKKSHPLPWAYSSLKNVKHCFWENSLQFTLFRKGHGSLTPSTTCFICLLKWQEYDHSLSVVLMSSRNLGRTFYISGSQVFWAKSQFYFEFLLKIYSTWQSSVDGQIPNYCTYCTRSVWWSVYKPLIKPCSQVRGERFIIPKTNLNLSANTVR